MTANEEQNMNIGPTGNIANPPISRSKGRCWKLIICMETLASLILILLAFSKLGFVAVYPREFAAENFLLSPLPNWLVMLVSAAIESFVAVKVFRNLKNPISSGLWLLWLCFAIGLYRLGMWIVAPRSACHCFGLIGLLTGSSKQYENVWAVVLLVFLAAIGLSVLLLSVRFRWTRSVTNVVVGLLSAFLARPANCAENAQALGISGTISSDYFGRDGKQINSAISNFRILVEGRHWKLFTQLTNSDSYAIASDGRTTFTLIQARNVLLPAETALIDPWNIPTDTPAESIPWWAFILSRDTEFEVTNLPTPWTVPRGDLQSMFCDTEITWSDSTPAVVAKAEFYYSEMRVASALDSPFLNRQTPPRGDVIGLVKAMKGLTNRFQAGEYEVTKWTNTAYGKLPSKFQLTVYDALIEQLYMYDPTNHTVKLRSSSGFVSPAVRIRYEGKVDGIVPAEFGEPTPHLGKPIWTSDYRFRGSGTDYVQYGPINHWTTNKSEVGPTMSGIAKFRTIAAVVEIRPAFWHRPLFVIGLIIILAFPLLLKLRRRRAE